MALLKSISASQVILAASILIIMVSSANGDGSSFCRHTDAGAEMALCKKLVNGAKTWEKALANVVGAVMAEAKKDEVFFNALPKYLPPKLKSKSKESILQTCKESHENLITDLKQVLKNIKSGDPMGSINYDLSAALSDLSVCTDGLDEFGVVDHEIIKARDVVQKYASISLAISTLKEH